MSLEAFREAVWDLAPPDAEPEALLERLRFLLEGVRPGHRVLDLGCGEGTFSAALIAAGARPIAVDAAEGALRRARERVEGLDARRWPDGAPLPVADASVDVAWAGEVLEHVVDLAPWLSEVRRALRPRSTLLVSTPHTGRAALLAAALSRGHFAERFEPRADHLRFFSPATLTELLDDMGFDVTDVRCVGGRPLARATILARAVRG
ncbi:MAG: class I SAM-dependent methyltransferase [Solirubrobacterales bacterium]|nr:class I SAM-dependent methyltransferase [Solirubrobacterales bacterium]